MSLAVFDLSGNDPFRSIDVNGAGTRGVSARVAGSLSSAARGLSFIPYTGDADGRYDLNVTGTFSATWRVVRSFDNGVTWIPASNAGVAQTFTGVYSEVQIEPAEGVVQVAVEITAYTSGTLNYEFIQ